MTTAKKVNQALRNTRSEKHEDKRPKVAKKFENEQLNVLFERLREIREKRSAEAEE